MPQWALTMTQDILHCLYNNVQVMVRGLIYKLVNMPAISNETSSDAMRNLYTKLTTVRQSFSQLEISDGGLATLFFIQTFERKLPDPVAQSWRRKVTKFEKEAWTKGQISLTFKPHLFNNTLLALTVWKDINDDIKKVINNDIMILVQTREQKTVQFTISLTICVNSLSQSGHPSGRLWTTFL